MAGHTVSRSPAIEVTDLRFAYGNRAVVNIGRCHLGRGVVEFAVVGGTRSAIRQITIVPKREREDCRIG